MVQRFHASNDTFTWPNGAIGHRPGGPFDCLGPYAKVRNCPIAGTELRLTCYATGYADTFFSVPACTRHRGKYITGFFSLNDGSIEFNPHNRHKEALGIVKHWTSSNGNIELQFSMEQAKKAHHQGQCDADVLSLSHEPEIAAQLAEIDPAELRSELEGYGAWDESELADHEQNLQRILWIACGDIAEGMQA